MFSVRMKSTSAQKTWLLIKTKADWICSYPRSPIAYGRFFVRAQAVIRADGCRPRKFERHRSKYSPKSADTGDQPLRAARANHVFCTEKTSVQKTRLLIKARADWIYFHPRSPIARGRFFIRATSQLCNNGGANQIATHEGTIPVLSCVALEGRSNVQVRSRPIRHPN